MRLLFLDTETTGNEADDRLLQVAWITEGQEPVCELFKPPLPIKIEAMATHHITEAMVADKPAFVATEHAAVLERLLAEPDSILVAHNAKFDIGMLEKEGLKVPRFICTLKVAKELDEKAVIPSYALQYLRYFLKLEVEGTAHDALGDVRVCRELFGRLHAKVVELHQGEVLPEDVLESMMQISRQPAKVKRFTFGKYKGQLVADVYKKDAAYLDWLWRQKMAENPRDEDWMATLEPYFMRQS